MLRSTNRVGHLSHSAAWMTSLADVMAPYALKTNELGSVSCFVCSRTSVVGSESPGRRKDLKDAVDGARTVVETGFSCAVHVDVPLFPVEPFVCADTVADALAATVTGRLGSAGVAFLG